MGFFAEASKILITPLKLFFTVLSFVFTILLFFYGSMKGYDLIELFFYNIITIPTKNNKSTSAAETMQ